MKAFGKFLILFLTGILLPVTIHAVKLHASHIRASDGMYQSTIYAIYQDEFGRMWFGTKSGLVTYDGIRTEPVSQLYADIPDAGEVIRQLTGDQQGKVYIDTRSGLIEHTIRTNHYRLITSNCHSMYYGKSGLWIAYKNTIYRWHKEELVPYASLPSENSVIDCLLETGREDVYAGTKDHGLFLIEKDGNISNLCPDIKQIRQLFPDREQKIWIATRRSGLYRLDQKQGIRHFRHIQEDPHSLSSDIIRSVCEDNSGNLWVATFNGLNKYLRKEERFVPYEFIYEDTRTLNDGSIYCLTKDAQGTIWSGSFYGEIHCFNPEQEPFTYHSLLADENNDPYHVLFGKTMEDANGNLWIASGRGGLYRFDSQQRKIEPISLGRHNPNVQTLWLDREKGILWVGTLLNGLIRYNIHTGQSNLFTRDILTNNSIREIIPYRDGFFLGTHNGIAFFDPATNQSVRLDKGDPGPGEAAITSMLLDRKEQLWVAAHNRLFCYDPQEKHWQEIRLDPDAGKINYTVTKLIENNVGDLWVGTSRNGLFLKKKGETTFQSITTEEGLMHNHIIDMAQDAYSNLVVVTEEGLSYIQSNLEITNVRRSKFLPVFQLSENCIYVDSKDHLYLGGSRMLCELPISQLFREPQPYTVNLSGIVINDVLQQPGMSGSLLQESSFHTQSLILPAGVNSLSVRAFTNNYTSTLSCGIQYRLEPFDKSWRNANSLNEITYTNLSMGTYRLRIRGDVALASGEYPERVLQLTVKPPFYATTWAYLLYIVIGMVLLYEGYQVVMLRYSLRVEKEQKKKMEELNQSKLRFFTNISHEFKTPITLIFSQIELILQSPHIPPKIHNRLISIWKNTTRMNRLIAELMEFRKQEQGFTPLKVNHHDLAQVVSELSMTYTDYAQYRKISLNLILEEKEMVFYFDRQQIEKALFNLLSNAFKFTPEKGSITLRLYKNAHKALIEVIDTGTGIRREELEKIFVRFYQSDNSGFTSSSGTGIGLAYARNILIAHQGNITVKSVHGQGSCFILELPTDISYPPEQIQEYIPAIQDEAGKEVQQLDREFMEEIREEQEKAQTTDPMILIVEDNEEVCELLCQLFAPLYTVETAVNGKEGYEKACRHKPDIVLTDVIMPEMPGTELCRRLKGNLETSHIPVVLLTSQASAEYITEGLKTGADDYICKPFNIKHLMIRCNNLVNSRKLLQKRYARETGNPVDLIATTSLDQALIEQSIRLIEENLENPLFSIDFLAREAGIGRTKYFNKIKAITGMTPNDFVTNIKLKMACRILKEEPGISTSELAFRLGFSSTSYFIKKFKEFSGTTPKLYRQGA